MQIAAHEPNIIWRALPNSSQELALDTRAQHTLYTGTRGPGKSECQLMRFRRRVGVGYGPFWRGVIFDREYKHLDEIVTRSKRLFHKFNDGAEFLSSNSVYKWVWPTGEELLFRVIKTADDYQNYHGQEFPFQGWNELTKWPSSDLYEMMMSCNRSSFTPEKDAPIINGKRVAMLPIPLEVFATCNSYGVGRNWVKRQFIDPVPYGQIIRTKFKVFNPKTQENDFIVERTQVAIFGSYKENIYLDPVYVAGLMKMCQSNENLRKSWLEGSWDVVAGGAFDDLWRRDIHIVPRFKIPSTWYVDRSFDWGSSHPFSVGWWAEANGEEATLPNGKKFAPAAGSLIQIGEWYGCQTDDNSAFTNKGLKMSGGDIAEGIKEREQQMRLQGYVPIIPWPGPADNQIGDVRESDVETIEKKMSDKGVRWQHSDKSKGSRRNGMQLFRDRLECAINGEGPAIYFMDNCRASIATIPVLPRDEKDLDDVDTDAEDHPYDMVRYRVLKGSNRLAKKVPVIWPT